MEKFPELINGQVVLVRADINTGHVLDEKFNLAINEAQKVFTLFDEAGIALTFAKDLILKNPNSECVIYSSDKKVLYHITIENVNLL